MAAANCEEISAWFDKGVEQGATHMIVVCDTFNWEDFPVYVMPDEDVFARRVELSTETRKVMEIYKFSLSKDKQMNEFRAFHY